MSTRIMHDTPSTGAGPADALARELAERSHGCELEPNGHPAIEHVRRVAEAVSPFARRVGWLHDALEWTTLRDEDLRSAGLRADELAAVRLLTREAGGDDDRTFLAHVRAIARAPGLAGSIARAVKRTDMIDRSSYPRDPGAPWTPPYDRALVLMEAEERASRRARGSGAGGRG
jgi:hypothetical protein